MLTIYLWFVSKSRRVRTYREDAHVLWIRTLAHIRPSAELAPTWEEIVRQELRSE